MQVTPTAIPDVVLVEPTVHRDARGWFYEAWNAERFAREVEAGVTFAQDNYAHSVRHALRGLHYQVHRQQGKLVWAVAGTAFDVAVDLRPDSATFGRWVGAELRADDHRQMWIPPGFAHGYLVLSESATLAYKATEFYAPEHERAVAWDDPDLGIDWPLDGASPVLSDRDAAAPRLADADLPGGAGAP